jgi:hypothetical protein
MDKMSKPLLAKDSPGFDKSLTTGGAEGRIADHTPNVVASPAVECAVTSASTYALF